MAAALLATSMFADNVLFKMAQGTTSNAATTASGADLDLNGIYYFYVGGSASVHNGQDKEATLVSGGIARITDEEGYIKITLPEGVTVQEGDIIRYTGNADESAKNILLHTKAGKTAGGRTSATQVAYDTDYTVKSTDVIVGANEFYINLGASVSAPNYVKSFTLSRPSELVKFYSFENMTPVDYNGITTTTGNTIVEGELYLNSDGVTTGNGTIANGIKAASDGKPQSLFSRGANENRALFLNVTDPCTVEIWAWSSQKDLSIYEGKYQVTDATKIITGTDAAANVIQKGTYTYTGLEDSKTLYTVPTGGFYVAAIRVTYTKIRPAADLAIDPTELTVKVGETKNFTITTSSNAKITRGKRGEDGIVSLGGLSNLDAPESTINANVRGTAVGTYVMTLTQAATADFRKGYAELTITVVDAATAIEDVKEANKAVKIIENGQVIILRDGVKYNVLGAKL